MSRSAGAGPVVDPEQAAAIHASERAIVVLAGPGSGKTMVLALRARHLLESDAAAHALLLTFTNKAAAEMKARAIAEAGVTSDRVSGNTFHSFAMQLLRSHGTAIGISGDFALLDDDQQKLMCEEIYQRRGIVDQLGRWSFLRVRQMDVRERLVQVFGTAYEEEKRMANALDFDDLVVYAAELLRTHPDIAAAYSARYPHLLVDEFQDTNAAQFEIVRLLAAGAVSISLFADDDQAIYQFAGAEAENVRRSLPNSAQSNTRSL